MFKVVHASEVLILTVGFISGGLSYWLTNDPVLAVLSGLSLFVLALILITYRLLSYVVLFLSHLIPVLQNPVVRDFLKRYGR